VGSKEIGRKISSTASMTSIMARDPSQKAQVKLVSTQLNVGKA
jgi:hypothetical protein